jgi:3-hydroxy-9,10-secoandrosta-1,3,5(10)-triene-9,17-dione monooxygenase
MFPEQAQQDFWADSPDTLSSSSFNPSGGTVTAAPGGYQVSGRWDYSSGCDAAAWVMVIGTGPAGPLLLMLPRRDYTIDDTWFVSGLRGTGSNDIVIENAFVPEYRTVAMKALGEACSPGRLVHDIPNNRIPLRSILSFTLSAAVLGRAQGALETFESNIKDQVSARSGRRLVESAGMQIRLAESDAEVRAARSLMQRDSLEIFDRARRFELPTQDDRARYRRDQCYITRLAVQAADRLFAASGGRGLLDSNALQRFHRDIHAAAHHYSLAWDGAAQQFGQVRLGIAHAGDL